MSERTSGWLPVEHVDVQGDPTETDRLVAALTQTGRDFRWTHGFHTYPAGLHPDSAGILLDGYSGAVYDPFTGGGTTLVEAMVQGRTTYGTDLSPIAVLVSTARTQLCDLEKVQRFRGQGRRIAEGAKRYDQLPRNPAVVAQKSWYDKHVAMELEGLRLGISRAPEEVQGLLTAAFSSLLVKCSHRRSDTSAVRDARHRAPETTAILFHKKVRELGRRLEAFRQAVPAETPQADVSLQDARRVTLPEPVTQIVTSPPYPAVYDYLPLQRLRLAWLDLPEPDDMSEIAPRRAFRSDPKWALDRWRKDLDAWLSRVPSQLDDGGSLTVVIGDGFSQGRAIDTLLPIEEAAQRAGLRPVARASGHREDLGPKITRREHVILFRK
ncbi:MAG: hypothetical protein GY913_24750 [Proteobacteria bacterium]|nr:hypothetical protein [Pseudomonadota bacterium]MCP4920125.1 hypothetical protein [Pseudomonadota bacterium]